MDGKIGQCIYPRTAGLAVEKTQPDIPIGESRNIIDTRIDMSSDNEKMMM